MIEERVRALGGAARSREIVRGRADRSRLAAAVADGRLIRVSRGVITCPGAEDLGVALQHGGALTCVSALARYGIPLLVAPTRCHVATPADHGRHPGPVLHWSTHRFGPGLVPVELALAHARRCLPPAEWIGAADAAVRQGVALTDLAAHRPRRGRIAFDASLAAVDGRSASLPESLLRVALGSHGLQVEPQAWVPGVGRVDLLVEDLVVEVDGFTYHSGRAEYREDRRRDRAALAAGYRVVRFTFEDVVHRRAAAVEEVLQIVTSRRGRRS